MPTVLRSLRPRVCVAVMFLLACATARPAVAQAPITDVLTFLLTNRSIPTGDFERDERAAIEARDVITRFLSLELATLPVSSSLAGFTYRLDSTLGVVVRSTESFGPFLSERALTAGRGQAAFGIGYRTTSFDTIDGRNLRDGSLVSTASRLRGDAAPFDIETVSLRIDTRTTTVTGNVGVTDRLDIGGALPIVRVTLQGQRVDTYRGRALVQATGSAVASGLGDVVLRAKYNFVRRGASGLAVAGEARLPTGDADDLLGAGSSSVTPRVIASLEASRLGLHGEVGYSFSDVSNSLGYGVAATVVALPRVTVVGELIGRRIDGLARLTDITQPHPRLVGVDTVRLSAVAQSSNRVLALAGVKWNVAGNWLLTANARRAFSDVGLDAGWVPTVALDYAFGR